MRIDNPRNAIIFRNGVIFIFFFYVIYNSADMILPLILSILLMVLALYIVNFKIWSVRSFNPKDQYLCAWCTFGEKRIYYRDIRMFLCVQRGIDVEYDKELGIGTIIFCIMRKGFILPFSIRILGTNVRKDIVRTLMK